MENYKPINGCVLVELLENLGDSDVPDNPSSATCGRVIAVVPSDELAQDLLNKVVWFKAYEDSACFTENEHDYAFIKHEEVRGYLE